MCRYSIDLDELYSCAGGHAVFPNTQRKDQKNWHVRNKDNIQRVRRDEEKAANEEKERQRKIALAEQEARTEFLRKKSRKILPPSSTSTDSSSITDHQEGEYGPQPAQSSALISFSGEGLASELQSGTKGFINFFKAEEEDSSTVAVKKNIDHEAERKAEQEEWEKKVGILTYLGQNSKELTGNKPWYERKRRKADEEIEERRKEVKHRKLQNSLDPMNQMTKYLEKKKKVEERDTDNDKSREKHKHKKKHKHRDRDKEVEGPKVKATKTIEQLRAERLRREAEEKRRAADVMAKARGEKPKEVQEEVVPERERKYNSQYNPEYVRRPKHRY